MTKSYFREYVRGPSIGVVLTARSLDKYANALPLCYIYVGAGAVEPVPLRAVHPHGALQVRGRRDALQTRMQVVAGFAFIMIYRLILEILRKII